MQRFRLKADGRIVELRDGQEVSLAPEALPMPADGGPPEVRALRRRARLTQQEFAHGLACRSRPSGTGEQGKRAPRGPARRCLPYRARAGHGVRRARQTDA